MQPPPFTSLVRLRGLIRALGLAIGVLMGGNAPAFAHGDDQIVIDALTEELAKKPDAELFLRRGELFRHHLEWAKADADFLAAARLQPDLTIVDYVRARTWLEAGAAEKARPLIERYVAHSPDEPEGRFLHGDVLAALGKHAAGAAEYAEGIRRAPRPRPEHFVRRAKFLTALPSADLVAVLAVLDEGIARLGPIISLVDYAVTLELERGNHEAALKRITAMLAHTPRRERWLVRRADVLALSGRSEAAVAAYREALHAIEQLPDRLRETVPMEKLARDARAAINRLAPR